MDASQTKTEKTFNVDLADKRMNEIKEKNSLLKNEVDSKINEGLQKLLQIILRSVTLNKKIEIGLIFGEERFKIRCIYDIQKDESVDIEFCFVRKYDLYSFSNEKEAEKNNMKFGDIKTVSFQRIAFDLLKGDTTEDFDCMVLFGYIAKELRNGGEFISTLKFIYDDLNKLWSDMEEGWTEYRSLNTDKQKHFKNIYEEQIKNGNYFQEGNVIIIRKADKNFVEASVYLIGKVQKTTFYGRMNSIEIKHVSNFNDDKKVYTLSVETYRYEEKRHSIDTHINLFASELVRGNKIEVLTTEKWEELQKDIQTESDSIKEGKTNLSEHYQKIKYKKEN